MQCPRQSRKVLVFDWIASETSFPRNDGLPVQLQLIASHQPTLLGMQLQNDKGFNIGNGCFPAKKTESTTYGS